MQDKRICDIRFINKKYLLLALAVIAGSVTATVTYSAVIIQHDYEIVETDYYIEDLKVEGSGSEIISKSLSSWFLLKGDTLRINIVNADEYQDKIPIVKKVILSNEEITASDSADPTLMNTYYIGWQRALEATSTEETLRQIPQHFEIISSEKGEGDITITFSPLTNTDGKLGSTKVLVDTKLKEMLKVHITIYQANDLSDKTLEAILRHELGHALGLPHSTTPTDLMHHSFSVESAYISQCDINGIITLYNEKNLDSFRCEN